MLQVSSWELGGWQDTASPYDVPLAFAQPPHPHAVALELPLPIVIPSSTAAGPVRRSTMSPVVHFTHHLCREQSKATERESYAAIKLEPNDYWLLYAST
jgi:hypothetical protein